MLTNAQTTQLRAACFADPTAAAFFAPGDGKAAGLKAHLNTTSAFIAWRTSVSAEEIGNAWNGADIDGMTSINMQRLQLMLASSPSGVYDMSRADRRTGFLNPFGTNQNNVSRVAMTTVWKRAATVAERMLATGTGTDAAPGAFTFQGEITDTEAAVLIYKDNGSIWTAQG